MGCQSDQADNLCQWGGGTPTQFHHPSQHWDDEKQGLTALVGIGGSLGNALSMKTRYPDSKEQLFALVVCISEPSAPPCWLRQTRCTSSFPPRGQTLHSCTVQCRWLSRSLKSAARWQKPPVPHRAEIAPGGSTLHLWSVGKINLSVHTEHL